MDKGYYRTMKEDRLWAWECRAETGDRIAGEGGYWRHQDAVHVIELLRASTGFPILD